MVRRVPRRPVARRAPAHLGRRTASLAVVAAVAGLGVVAPPAAQAASLRFTAEATTRVEERSPSTNYAGSSSLRVDADPDVQSLLRFTVRGTTGGVSRALLRVFAVSDSADGPAVHATPSGWSEGQVTWRTRPALDDEVADDVGPVAEDSWMELDVTSLVPGDGTYSFALVATSGDGVDFKTRRSSSRPPELLVTPGPAVPLPPAPDPAPSPDPLPPPSGGGAVDPARQTLLAPAEGALFGLHLQLDSSLSRDERKAVMERFEGDLGRTAAIDSYYEPWGDTFPTWREPYTLSKGRIPMISWGKVASDLVNLGVYDDYIAARADGVRSLGQPVFLRWFWEMDVSWKSVIAGPPSAYTAAWRRIRGIFEQRGATNVAWVWCPNASAFEDGEAQSYYPGDEWVDWVCGDGYNWYPDDGRSYETFTEKFVAMNDWAATRGKPAMAGEFAAQRMEPGRRAEWLAGVAPALESRLTSMLAIVYFHSSGEHDWRLLDEPDAFAAFRELGLSPYLNP